MSEKIHVNFLFWLIDVLAVVIKLFYVLLYECGAIMSTKNTKAVFSIIYVFFPKVSKISLVLSGRLF